jgi:hypothetical protein
LAVEVRGQGLRALELVELGDDVSVMGQLEMGERGISLPCRSMGDT